MDGKRNTKKNANLRKARGYWTKSRCAAEARKYKTKTDFQRAAGGAYHAARRNGWLGGIVKWVDGIRRAATLRTKWTKEACTKEAEKCGTRTEFKRNSPGAYIKALKTGRMRGYAWVKPAKNTAKHKAGWWTPERALRCAKRCRNMTTFEFHQAHTGAYNTLKKAGLVGQAGLKGYKARKAYRKTGAVEAKWTAEKCLAAAKKCGSRTEFMNNHGVAYTKALKSGWLKDYAWLKPRKKPNGHWTAENALKCARTHRKMSAFEFNRAFPGAYRTLRTSGLVGEAGLRGYRPKKEYAKRVASK